MEINKIIAIIDDDKIYHLLTQRILEKSGVPDKLLQFYDGQEALTFFAQNQNKVQNLPDLIFLDIEMPFIDGWQFLDEYSALTLSKPITIYIVSSSISSLDQEKFHHYKNIKGFIVKPFSRDKILNTIKEFYERD